MLLEKASTKLCHEACRKTRAAALSISNCKFSVSKKFEKLYLHQLITQDANSILCLILKYFALRASQELPQDLFFPFRGSRAPALENHFPTSQFAGASRSMFFPCFAVRKLSARGFLSPTSRVVGARTHNIGTCKTACRRCLYPECQWSGGMREAL